MDSDQLFRLLQQAEGLKLDFKKELHRIDHPDRKVKELQRDELVKDLLSLLNGNVGTAGQTAYLIIGAGNELGADKSRDLFDVGEVDVDRLRKQIIESVNRACNPPVPDIQCDVSSVEGKRILAIIIPPSPHLHETTRRLDTPGAIYQQNTVFIRRAEGTGIASLDESLAIRAEKLRFSQAGHQAARDTSSESSETAELRHLLATRLSDGDLRTLCFDLGIDYDDLPGEGKSNKIRELLAYLGRRERLPDLIQFARRLRPDIWGEASHVTPDASPKRRVPFVLPQLDIPTFTGRDQELNKLEELLVTGKEARLCSIIGMSGSGGIGKSALACHFAELHKADFPDGVIGLRVDEKDADTLAREFARHGGEEIAPDDDRDATTIMQEVFRDRRALLIFDNARSEDAPKLRSLRPGGDRCVVIITTRDRGLPDSLDIPAGGSIDLPTLPDPESINLLKLLVGEERLDAEPEAAREIVSLVGNLPLALRIVGSTLRVQTWRSLTDYAASLRDERARLAKLKIRGDSDLDVWASFSLSLKSLEQSEADFFACLSVCARDGFSVPTTQAVGNCDESTAHERLAILYRLSLLNGSQTGMNRFVFHTLIRLFAHELAVERKLLEAAEERHARYFIEFVESNDVNDSPAASFLTEELDDVILTAKWLQRQETADYEFVIRLQPFFEQYGHWQEAVDLMSGFLSLAERIEDWNTVVQLRVGQAKYLSLRGEWSKAQETLSPIPNILDRIKARVARQRCEAMWLNTVGILLRRQGHLDEAEDAFHRSNNLNADLGDLHGQALTLNSLGGILQRQGHLDEAIDVFKQSIMIEEQLGDQRGLAKVLNSLGGVLQRQGRFDEAVNVLKRSATIEQQLGNQRGQAIVLTSLGGVLQDQGHFDEAVDAFHRSLVIEEQLGNQRGQAKVLNSLLSFQ
jgi:tetratricopeptide (TPR) repeat protein